MLIWNVFTQVLLPILVMFGIGWVLDRRFRFDIGTLVKLNIYLFVPAFIFVQIVQSDLSATLAVRVVAFSAAIIASMFILGALVGRVMGYERPQTRALQLAAMFYNSGNYGIPLMALAYPGAGPVLQVFVVVTMNVTTFTVGVLLAANSQHTGWRAFLPVLRQASIWAVSAAFLVRAWHLPVPEVRWLWVPLQYFAGGFVAIALITLGAQISKTARPTQFTRLGWALVLRLLAAPLIACALVGVFGFTGETAKIMILGASFPTAVNIALLAHEFDADSHFAASAVFASTLLSMITVTALIAILRII